MLSFKDKKIIRAERVNLTKELFLETNICNILNTTYNMSDYEAFKYIRKKRLLFEKSPKLINNEMFIYEGRIIPAGTLLKQLSHNDILSNDDQYPYRQGRIDFSVLNSHSKLQNVFKNIVRNNCKFEIFIPEIGEEVYVSSKKSEKFSDIVPTRGLLEAVYLVTAKIGEGLKFSNGDIATTSYLAYKIDNINNIDDILKYDNIALPIDKKRIGQSKFSYESLEIPF